jgi:hypothetical protein
MIKKLLLSVSAILGLGIAASAQYCTPVFSTGCGIGDEIGSFTTSGGTQNITTNLSTGCSPGFYIYHSTATVGQVQGQSFSFTVQSGATYAQGFRIWVDWNNDQDFTDAGEDMWNSVTNATTPFTGSITVPISVSPGVKRMRVRCNWSTLPTDPCASQTYGEAEDFNLLVLALGPCQAVPFVGLTTTTKAITCSGETFSLAVDTMTFGSGQHYQWQISPNGTTWASMPNDTNISVVTSQSTTNHYRLRVICGAGTPVYSTPVIVTTTATALPGGTYTINGGLATGGTNFNSFADFKQAIVCGGIAGPVTVNVINKGSDYAEQLDFGLIGGASATNKITINGNGQTLTSAGGAQYATMRFNGSKYFKIKNLIIEGTGAANSWGVQVTGGSEYLEFDSVTVTMGNTGTGFSTSAFVINGNNTSATGTGLSGSHITVKNSIIEGGYYGFVLAGSAGAPFSTNNLIENNEIRDFYLYGLYIVNQDSSTFRGNDINRATRTTLTTFYAIYVNGNCTDVTIDGNKIHNASGSLSGTYTAYPMYLISANASAADPMVIANNAIYDIKTTGTIYAIYLSSGANIDFYHNTVGIDNSAITGAGTLRMFISFASTGTFNIKNNIFALRSNGTGAKHLIYLSSTSPTWNIDNNQYYLSANAGSNFLGYWSGANVANFTAWQAVNSAAFDGDGVYGDPVFDISEFTPQHPVGNAGGANLLSIVPNDLNGVARTATPDIGAVEFTPLSCLQPNILGGSSTSTSITINWTNDPAADSVRIEYGGSGFVQGTGTAIYSSGSTITISGLNPQQCYDFYFQTWCNGSVGNGQSLITICTKCAAKPTPLVENWDGITASNNTTNPGLPSCWAYFKSPNHTGYAYTYSFATPNTTPNHVRFYSGATTVDTLSIISPAIQGLTAGDKRIKFFGLSGSTLYNQRVIIGTTASPEQMGTLDILDTVVVNSTWTEYTVYLDSANGYNGTHEYVVIMQGALNGTFQSMYVDDVTIEQVPQCNPPTSISSPTIGTTTTQVAWTSLNGTCFDLEYGPQGFIQGTGNGTLVTNVTSPYTITGLTPNTFYSVYVRDCCNPNAWTGPHTFKTNCLSQLSGTYTVGGTAGPTNFATLDSAISVLTGCGVSGPVTFNLQGATRKNISPKIFGNVVGTSATNTVTFNGRGVSGDTVLVAGGTVGLTFNGTKYIKFQNMTINGAATSITVRLHNVAEYITFENCHIWNNPTTTTFSTAVIAASAQETSATSSGNNANNITLKNCKLVGGYYGFSIYGVGTTQLATNFTIENCEFVDQYYYGLYLGFVNNVIATGNNITVNRNTFAYGLYSFSSNNITLKQNEIFASYSGLYFSSVNTLTPAPTTNSEISNNFMGGGTYGFYASTIAKFNFYHNSVRGGNSGYYAFGTNPDLDIRNNIFVGGSGYGFYNSTLAPTTVTLNYNLYHTTGASIAYNGTAFATLSAWQTAQSTLNINSLAGDPGFLSNSDFRIIGTLPNDAGQNGLATVDIDGDVRPASGSTIVDIGADEFTPLNWDASLEAFMVPLAGCGDSAMAMSVVVKNLGLNTITSLPISVAITGGITATVNTTATVNMPVGSVDTISAGTFNAYNGAAGVNFAATISLVGDQKATNNSQSKGPGTYIPFEPLTSGVVDTVCANGDSVDLYALYIPGTRYAWYNTLTGGTKIANGDTLTVPANGPSTYYVAYDSATANPQVGVGTTVSTSTNITPYKTFYMDGRSQYLILASEMAALGVVGGGEINSLAFDVVTVGAPAMNDFTVKMGGTAVTAMTGTFQPTSGMITVFNAASYSTVTGWNVHTFSTPFIWNGTDNILIEVCYDNNAWTSNSSVNYSITPFQSTTDGFTDNTAASGCTPGVVTPTVSSNRPNMLLNMKTIACSNIRKPVSFSVNPNSAVAAFGFTVQPNGADVTFNAAASTGTSFDWTFGDGGTGSGVTVQHTYATGGSYTVCLVVTDSVCNSTDTICQTVLATVGIEEGLIGQSLNLYPNPNDGKFRVEFQVEGLKNVEVRVMSLLGQVLYSNKPGNVSGTYREELDLSSQAAGVYILQIISEDGTVSRRVTVRK